MNCITCKFNEGGACHRYPPQVSIVLVPRMSLVNQKTELQPTDMAAFPAVQEGHWCGEFVKAVKAEEFVPVFNTDFLNKGLDAGG